MYRYMATYPILHLSRLTTADAILYPNAERYRRRASECPTLTHWRVCCSRCNHMGKLVGSRKQGSNVPYGTGRMIDQRLFILCGVQACDTTCIYCPPLTSNSKLPAYAVSANLRCTSRSGGVVIKLQAANSQLRQHGAPWAGTQEHEV
jgi:hypothetical protein